MKIRAYHATDESAVLALWNTCGLISPGSDPQGDIRRKLSTQLELFLVGTLDSALIATAMAGYDGHRGYLYYLAVSPDHQRKGYGRSMVVYLQGLLRERGCPKLNLFVNAENVSAFAFYERLGFTRNDMVSLGQGINP